jgi:cytochrome c553
MGKFHFFLVLLLGVAPAATVHAAESTPRPDPQLIAKCQECHDPAGSRSTPATPRLNGQGAGYLFRRLNDFLDPARGSPRAAEHMWQTATTLKQADAARLASFLQPNPLRQPIQRCRSLPRAIKSIGMESWVTFRRVKVVMVSPERAATRPRGLPASGAIIWKNNSVHSCFSFASVPK